MQLGVKMKRVHHHLYTSLPKSSNISSSLPVNRINPGLSVSSLITFYDIYSSVSLQILSHVLTNPLKGFNVKFNTSSKLFFTMQRLLFIHLKSFPAKVPKFSIFHFFDCINLKLIYGESFDYFSCCYKIGTQEKPPRVKLWLEEPHWTSIYLSILLINILLYGNTFQILNFIKFMH